MPPQADPAEQVAHMRAQLLAAVEAEAQAEGRVREL